MSFLKLNATHLFQFKTCGLLQFDMIEHVQFNAQSSRIGAGHTFQIEATCLVELEGARVFQM
jgi:hypothetical protein